MTLTRQVAQGLRRVGRDDAARRVEGQATRDDNHAGLIRTRLLQVEESPGAQVRAVMQTLDTAQGESRL